MPLLYENRKGFNYEKSSNPKKNGASPVHTIRLRKNGSQMPTQIPTFTNKFTGGSIDKSAFHAEIDEIRNGIIDKEKNSMI